MEVDRVFAGDDVLDGAAAGLASVLWRHGDGVRAVRKREGGLRVVDSAMLLSLA